MNFSTLFGILPLISYQKEQESNTEEQNVAAETAGLKLHGNKSENMQKYQSPALKKLKVKFYAALVPWCVIVRLYLLYCVVVLYQDKFAFSHLGDGNILLNLLKGSVLFLIETQLISLCMDFCRISRDRGLFRILYEAQQEDLFSSEQNTLCDLEFLYLFIGDIIVLLSAFMIEGFQLTVIVGLCISHYPIMWHLKLFKLNCSILQVNLKNIQQVVTMTSNYTLYHQKYLHQVRFLYEYSELLRCCCWRITKLRAEKYSF